MSIGSIKRKINAKTLLGQSSALRENSETLKKGVAKLASVLIEKRKIKTSTLMATKEKEPQVEVVREEEKKEEKKKSGFGLPPFLPTLAGLAGLAGAFALSPKVFSKRLLKAILKRAFGFVEAIGKRLFKIFRAIGRSIRRVFNRIRRFFRRIFNGISDNVKKLKNFFDDKILRPLREAFESAIDSKWFQKLRKFFDDIAESIKGFIKRSAERFKTFADDIFKRIKTTVNDLVDRGIKAFKGILDEIAEKILKPLKETVIAFVENVKKRLANAGQIVINEISERVVKPIQENIIQPLIKQVTEGVTNVIDGLEKNILGAVDNFIPEVPTKLELPGPIKGAVELANKAPGINIPTSLPTPDFLLKINDLKDNLKGAISNVSGGIKSLIQDPVSSIRRVMTLGGEKLTQLQDFGKGVSEQFKVSLLDPIINGAKQIGQSAADIGRGFASNVGERVKQAQDLAKKLDPMQVVREIPGRISEIAGNIINPVRNAVVTPLTDIVSGGARGLGNALVSIGGGLGKAGDALGAVRGGLNNMVSFFNKIPLPQGVKKAFQESTGRFDRYFAIAESAASYALAVKNKKTGESTDIGPFKDLKGQMLGNAILTAAGGFLGSAIGGAIATPIPIPFSGFIGTVIGGIIGEEFGKFAAAKVAGMMEDNGIPNRDPFLSDDKQTLPIFHPNEPNLISMIESGGIGKLFGFGGGGEEEPQPKAEGGTIPTPAFTKRRFDLMEDYTEYITDTEVVIITKESVVNNVVQTPTVQQGKGGMIPLPIGSGESILDNFRSRALSQLAYN